jgi:hypothetical protein
MRQLLLVVTLVLLGAVHATAEGSPPEGWTRGDLGGGLVWGLAADPERPGRFLARTTTASFLLEDDRWRRAVPPGAGWWTRVTPVGGRLWSEVDGRVVSSRDGVRWRGEGDARARVLAFVKAGVRPGIIGGGFEPTDDGRWRLFVAGRAGDSLRRIGQGVVDAPRDPELDPAFEALLAHPRTPDVLRFFLRPSPVGEEAPRTVLLSSLNGGREWTAHAIGYAVNGVVQVDEDPKILFAVERRADGAGSSLLRSDDAGRTFRRIGDDARLRKLRCLATPDGGRSLLVGTREDGLLRVGPDGKVRGPAAQGLPGAQISALAVGPGRAGTVLAGTQVGVWWSEDAGRTFLRRSDGLAGLQTVGLLAFADGRLISFDYLEAPATSTDGGRTWTSRTPDRVEEAYDVLRGGSVILVLRRPDAGNRHRISVDGGRSWRSLEVDGEPCGIGAGGEVYARAPDGRLRVLRTRGEWSTLAALPEGDVSVWGSGAKKPILCCRAGGVDLLDPTTGERRKTVPVPDGGKVWTRVFPDPLLSDVVFLQGQDGSVFRLDVSEKKLVRVHRRDGQIHGGLAGSKADPERRYFAYGDGPLLLSDDEGRTWRPLRPAPGFASVRGLAVSRGRLVAAADGAIHSIPLGELR